MNNDYGNPWIFNDTIFYSSSICDYSSFVYIITNILTNRKYIGKKCFHSIRKVKGKRKKCFSDWEKYYGSNDTLKQDVKEFGADNFKREIIYLCSNKAEASYLEAKLQFENDVLLSDNWYNGWIMCRVTKTHLKSLVKD
jgi:hypothetical protein